MMRIKDNPDLARNADGAIINTNRAKLMAARRQQQTNAERDAKIKSLELRLAELEEIIRTIK
jgi:hypothetical protein